MSDLVQQWIAATTDWDGTRMPDGSEPRLIPTCGELRRGADELSRLRAELEEATTSLRLSRGGFAHCAAENQMLRAELDEALKVVRAAEEWNAADPRLAVVYAASHALATAVAQWASTHAAAHSAPDGGAAEA